MLVEKGVEMQQNLYISKNQLRTHVLPGTEIIHAFVNTYFVYTVLQLAWHLCIANVVGEWCGSCLSSISVF